MYFLDIILILYFILQHLDLDTIDGLISALKNYKGGAVILISHDRHFLSSVVSSSKNIKHFNYLFSVMNTRL